MLKDYAIVCNASDDVLWWVDNIACKQQATTQQLEHIIDYLVSDAAPKRLKKMSFEQAKTKARQWSLAQQKKGAHLVDTEEDIKRVLDLGNGYCIVELLTKKAFEREGFLMHHCLGGMNPSENTKIYSYRDSKNNPHATFEVSIENEMVTQIKGKGNGFISPKYIEPVLKFLDFLNIKIRPSDMVNLGFYHVPTNAIPLLNSFVDPNGKAAPLQLIRNEYYISAAH